MTIKAASAALFAAAAAAAAFVAVAAPSLARAQEAAPSLASTTEFRVCGDPANLPFSNEKREGFENKIADLFAGYLHEPVTTVWFPQIVGFLRNTLFAHRCDVVMGTVAGADMVDTTNPYYHTGYVLVTRSADHITSVDLGDPVFSDKKIGLIASTPPTDIVARHHLLAHVTPYNLTVDTRVEAPSRTLLLDLVAGKIDVGLVWGPFAGYYITHDHLPLAMALMPAEPGGPRLDYRIAMGVRPSDVSFRRTLNDLIRKHQEEITAVLRDYGVPLLDEQGNPLKP
jgi:quinoprotein dehydrogenase-associated probable ABC transporter substrate-binding protein